MKNRQLSIRSRLALFVAVPLVSLLVLSITLSLTQEQQFQQANRHREFVQLSKPLIDLMVAMQMERAALSESFDVIEQNRTQSISDEAIRALSQGLPTPYGYFGLEAEFGELVDLLQQLPDVRAATRADHEIAAYYSMVVQRVIVILQSLVVDAKDVKLHREIETLLDLLALTESVQLERYAVLAVIRRGAVDKDTLSALRSVEVSQMHHAERILWLSGRSVSKAELFPDPEYVVQREAAISVAIRRTTILDLSRNLMNLLAHRQTLLALSADSLALAEDAAEPGSQISRLNKDIRQIVGDLGRQSVPADTLAELTAAIAAPAADLQRLESLLAQLQAIGSPNLVTAWQRQTRIRADSIYRVQRQYEASVMLLTRQYWQGVKFQFWVYLGSSALVFVVTVLLGFLLARRVVGGLVEMTEKIRIMDRTHELMPALPAEGTDELAHLARSFNDLVRKLNAAGVRERALQQSLLDIERRQNAELERRVEIRTRELESARIEAEAANQAKSRFLGNISHHVRTPLNAIQGFAQLLLREDLNHSQQQKLLTIQENGDQLLTMMDNILSLVRLEKGEIKPVMSHVMLEQFFNEVAARASIRAKAGRTQFRLHQETLLPVVVLDKDLLDGTLHEILDNAFKFTQAGTVELSVSYGQNQLQVTIKDTGKGIAEDQLEHLVGTFEQATAGCELGGGIGIGLTLVSRRMQVLGGQMSVQSEPGVGTEVSLVIPAAALPDQKQLIVPLVEQLCRLPAPLIARLRDSIAAADIVALGQAIEEVRFVDVTMAETLTASLESYDFDALDRLTAAG